MTEEQRTLLREFAAHLRQLETTGPEEAIRQVEVCRALEAAADLDESASAETRILLDAARGPERPLALRASDLARKLRQTRRALTKARESRDHWKAKVNDHREARRGLERWRERAEGIRGRKDLRIALQSEEVDRLQAELTETKTALRRARENHRRVKERGDRVKTELRERLAAQALATKNARRKLQRLQDKTDRVNQACARAEGSAASASASAKTQVRQARDRVDAARARADKLREELVRSRKQYDAERASHRTTTTALREARAHLARARYHIAKLQGGSRDQDAAPVS